MKPRLLLALLALAAVPLPAASPAPAKAPAAQEDPDAGLTTYYVGLITRGPNFDAYNSEDRAKIQRLHLDNIERLAGLGKLLVAGPFTGGGEWLGIFIFKCSSLEEARQLAATDPAVQTGRFRIEIHPWRTTKGSIRDPEFAAAK
ncbi:MAG: hypothetical protein JSR48_05150 [Verrucomicrobia bacterium]|nr:hypothetical protein [Verrucomicrobiota bacterium]